MTRAARAFPRFPPFFSRSVLSFPLFPFFSFFFSPSHAFVLACLYTGHAFPRNGSAYELRARWEYGMERNFWMQVGKQQYEIPGKSSAYTRAAEFIYMNFNKTCLYRITAYQTAWQCFRFWRTTFPSLENPSRWATMEWYGVLFTGVSRETWVGFKQLWIRGILWIAENEQGGRGGRCKMKKGRTNSYSP